MEIDKDPPVTCQPKLSFVGGYRILWTIEHMTVCAEEERYTRTHTGEIELQDAYDIS